MIAFAPFQQLAYVTNDMDQAMAVFARDYGVPSFHTLEVTLKGRIRGVQGSLDIRGALANLDGVQIELIEPRGGMDAIYRDAIAGRDGFALQFHHIARLVPDRGALAKLRSTPGDAGKIALDGGQEGVEYIYTDERPTLGHHIEHIWYAREVLDYLEKIVPRFTSQ